MNLGLCLQQNVWPGRIHSDLWDTILPVFEEYLRDLLDDDPYLPKRLFHHYTRSKYRSIIDLISCEAFPSIRRHCRKYYKDPKKYPQLRYLINDHKRQTIQTTLILQMTHLCNNQLYMCNDEKRLLARRIEEQVMPTIIAKPDGPLLNDDYLDTYAYESEMYDAIKARTLTMLIDYNYKELP